MAPRCVICAKSVGDVDREQHATGDYHKACFESIAAARLRVGRAQTAASCVLCGHARSAQQTAHAVRERHAAPAR